MRCFLVESSCRAFFFCVIISSYTFKHWFDTKPQICNPIKQIVQVLNYARKNKWPRLRSAFTYIDEEQPLRLDFGKSKFGGPFTEEEVEDVKTVLRLLPLLPVMVTIGLAIEPATFAKHTFTSPNETTMFYYCILEFRYTLFFTIVVLFVPVYHFCIYPFLYKWVPGMLKRTGLGLIITTASLVGYLIIDLSGHNINPDVGCMFNSTSEPQIPISPKWVIIPQILMGIGDMLALVSSLEFVCAQAPASMRGLMIGLWFAAIAIQDLIGLNLHYLFQYIPGLATAIPSCGTYYYAMKIALSIVLFILFVILSKRYTFRERNRVINLHFITEEHFERYIDAEHRYEQDRSRRQYSGETPSSNTTMN